MESCCPELLYSGSFSLRFFIGIDVHNCIFENADFHFFIYFDEYGFVIIGMQNAEHTTRGYNFVAFLHFSYFLLYLFLLFALRTDDKKPENEENQS